jgi:hypothetical protein
MVSPMLPSADRGRASRVTSASTSRCATRVVLRASHEVNVASIAEFALDDGILAPPLVARPLAPDAAIPAR